MSDFLDDVLDGMDEAADLCGDTFTLNGAPVVGDWTGAAEGISLGTTGGKEQHLRGTLVISRRRLPQKPEIGLVITDACKVRYRIHNVLADAASWTLTLSAPNNGHRP